MVETRIIESLGAEAPAREKPRWPDYVVAFVQVVFVLALLPSIFGPSKPSLWTSLITTSGLTAMMIAFAAQRMHYSVVTSGLAALAWAVLLSQVLP